MACSSERLSKYASNKTSHMSAHQLPQQSNILLLTVHKQ